MTGFDALYTALKPDIEAVASPLLEFSQKCLRQRGNFLPHAAVLTEAGEVRLVAADPGHDQTNSTEVLPLLHGGLRAQASEISLMALGVAENVTIALGGQRATKAIKVLVEHKRGLTVALYLPFEKKFLKGYVSEPCFLSPQIQR
jgi:hypothetical protein